MLTVIQRCVLTLLTLSASLLMAQSERDCQDATKLFAEAEAIQELFNKHWEPTVMDGAPALGRDEDPAKGHESLQARVRKGLSDCQNKGSSGACGNYKRVRDVWRKGSSSSSGSAKGYMYTDPNICKVYDYDTDQEVDQAKHRPSGGLERASWDSAYKHEQFHRARCRSANGLSPDDDYDWEDNPSPYLERMRDPRLLAEEEAYAYEITKGVLEDYLKENCFDLDLFISTDDLVGQCGDSAEGAARLRSLAQSAKSWLMNTANRWLRILTSEPVRTSPGETTTVPLKGDCFCCNHTTKYGDVRVYGGPGYSIMVGKEDVNMGCAADVECGALTGDPHVRTYDGLSYDFQGHGEFVLARGEGFEVQARMQPRNEKPVTVGTAVAVQLDGLRVAMYAGKPLKIDVMGSPLLLEVGGSLSLPGGSVIERDRLVYRLLSADGFVLEVRPGSRNLNLRVGLPPGVNSIGLLGNLDGDTENDLLDAGGSVLTQPVDFASLYQVFGAAWRVTTDNTLFDYEEGQGPGTVGELLFPPTAAHVRDLTSAERRKAEAVCREAGVSDAVNMENCVLDVGFTGDEEFAEFAAEEPPAKKRLELRDAPSPPAPAPSAASAHSRKTNTSADGVSFDAPAEGIAAHPVEITLNGPVQEGYRVRFAPVASRSTANVENPYSRANMPADKRVIELVAPTTPGNYELRYIEPRGERRILLSQPFRSLQPEVAIQAATTVLAGGSIDIRVLGDLSPNMSIAVVPAGSPDSARGPQRPLQLGSDVNVQVRKLPEEPGDYEIRCVTKWGAGRQVYARKKLTIR